MPEWLLLGILAVACGSFTLRVPGVPVHASMSDTFLFTSVILFGPAPATAAIAVDGFLRLVAPQPPGGTDPVQHRQSRAGAVGRRPRLHVPGGARAARRAADHGGGGGAAAGGHGRPALPRQLGVHGDRRGAGARRLALRRLAAALRGVLAQPRRLGLGGAVPARAGPALRGGGPCRRDADGGHRLSRAALALRPARRCRTPRQAGRPALHVDDPGAVDGHRGQGRRDQQPHPPRADLLAGPRPRRRRHRPRHAEGHRGGLAAPRHRQAGRARAHPEQAGPAHAGRVRGDEAARRRRRRHPLVDRLPLPRRADRAGPPRELGRHRLSTRREG